MSVPAGPASGKTPNSPGRGTTVIRPMAHLCYRGARTPEPTAQVLSRRSPELPLIQEPEPRRASRRWWAALGFVGPDHGRSCCRPERLRIVDELRDAELVSADEYSAQRREILGSLVPKDS